MNIEVLHEYVSNFKKEVIESGFKRDLDDYITSLPSLQNNIVALRDVSEKVLSTLENLYSSDLPQELSSLLPGEQIRPFTEIPFNVKLRELLENTDIQQKAFFSQLTQILNQLKQQIDQNINEISKIEQFISPYITDDIKRITEEYQAIISVIFKDNETISSLKQFTKILGAWNRMLPVYHQLLKSDPPEDIRIVEVQNGSIDFVLNINVDVALNLVDLFKLGFQVFASYLAYKKMIRPIIDSYHGNKDLIKQEAEREKLLLGNIGIAIQGEIKKQYKEAKKKDKKIDGTSISKKIEQVTDLITSHIVKGNDLRLLALPELDTDEDNEYTTVFYEKKNLLKQQSMIARKHLESIPKEDRIKLLEMYSKIDEET